jgi:2-dehydro-3-deoxyphosphooctonate aldolase (KDO 8-P synthase)
MVCERGASWGPSNLVFDPRQLLWMRQLDCPVVSDVTHSCQHPVANEHYASAGSPARSRGSRGDIAAVARASVAVGVDGVFIECHDDIATAPVDGNLQWPIERLDELIDELVAIGEVTRGKTTDYIS